MGSLGRGVRDVTYARLLGATTVFLAHSSQGARGAPRGAGSLGLESAAFPKKTVKTPSRRARVGVLFARSFDVWRVPRRKKHGL